MTTAEDDRLALEERLAAESLDAGDFALLNSLRAYYDEHDPVPDGIVLGYGALPDHAFEAGLRALGDLFAEALAD